MSLVNDVRRVNSMSSAMLCLLDLGVRIRDLREASGLTRRDVAGRAGCSVTTVAMLEADEPGHCSLHFAQRILEVLGVDPADLVGGTPGAMPLCDRVQHMMERVRCMHVGSHALQTVLRIIDHPRVRLVARGSDGTMFDAAALAVALGGWAEVLSSPDVPAVELVEVA